jgi:hypothetical protein
MESQTQPIGYDDIPSASVEAQSLEAQAAAQLEAADSEAIAMLPPATSSSQRQWESFKTQTANFLDRLPQYWNQFFSQYRQPITAIALVLIAIITLRVLFVVLDTLNSIPLLRPTFELVGIAYSAWFIYRYLLKVETRQELSEQLRSFRNQVLG